MERWKFVFYTFAAYALSPLMILARLFRGGGKKPPKKILVIPIMTRVGDLVCATPVFRAIKEHYPESHLSVLVGKKVIDVIRSNPRIDELININDIPFKGFWGRGRLFLFLRRCRFDAVVSLTNNPFNNLAAFYSSAQVRIKTTVKAPTFAEGLTDWFNTEMLTFEQGTFLQDHYIHLLGTIGIPFTKPTQEMYVTAEGEKKAEAYLRDKPIKENSLFVGMSISAGNKVKEWPQERFVELVRSLIDLHKATIVFIDSASNESRVREVISKVERPQRVYGATDFSLAEVPSLVKRCSLFIAVDTGLIYVAHALGVPVIDIVGPVDPNEQPPSDEQSAQVLPPADIKPSSFVLHPPGTVEERREAVLAISVAGVLAAFDIIKNRVMLRQRI